MKKIYALLFLLIATVSISCKKENTNQTENKLLTGNWQLVAVTGGLFVVSDVAAHSLKITETTFERYVNNKLISSLPYTLSTGISPANNKPMRSFVFTGVNTIDTYFELAGNKLTIYNGAIASDGTIEVFQRQ